MIRVNKKPIIRGGPHWNDTLERQWQREIIVEKKDIFRELCIPFPAEIEEKFKAAIGKGDKNIDIYLDNLCHDYIKYAYEHYEEVMHNYLLSINPENIFTKKDIQNLFDRDGFKELMDAKIIRKCGKGIYEAI